VESEEWQIGEIQAGMAELDAGHGVSHEKGSEVAEFLGQGGRDKSAEMRIVWSRRAIRQLVALREYIAKAPRKMPRSSRGAYSGR